MTPIFIFRNIIVTVVYYYFVFVCMILYYFVLFSVFVRKLLIKKNNGKRNTAAFHVHDRSLAVYELELQTLQLRAANINIFRGVVEFIGDITRVALVHHDLPNIIGFAPRPQAVVGAKIGAGQKKHPHPDDVDVVRQDLGESIYESYATLIRPDHLKRVIRPRRISAQQAHNQARTLYVESQSPRRLVEPHRPRTITRRVQLVLSLIPL